jgi:hypothetical protein
VDTGSPPEDATTQREKGEARFYQNGIRSSDFPFHGSAIGFRAFSGEVDAGSPQKMRSLKENFRRSGCRFAAENAITQREESEFRFR